MADEKDHISAAIADLQAWQDQIAGAIQTLQLFMERGPMIPVSAPPGAPHHTGGHITGDAFFQMTVPDAAEKYFKIVKVTKEIPELAAALLKGGLKSSSAKFPNMVRTIVSRDPRFVKTDAGWGLTEWYPAMRKEKKPKAVKEPPKKQKPSAEKPEPKGVPSGAAEKILETMKSDSEKEWTVTRLTEATGLNQKTVQGTVFRLRKSGHIKRRHDGLGYVAVKTF